MLPETKKLLTQHPKTILRTLVAQAVQDVFHQTDWQPRVVRIHKKKVPTKLGFIDYMVPCFELEKILNLPLEEITRQLAEQLTKQEQDPAQAIQFKVEYIGGYLNFQLSDEWLAQICGLAADWFANPQSPSQQSFAQLSVVSPSILQDNNSLAIATTYLQQIYAVLGVTVPQALLISDNSAAAIEYVSTHAENGQQEQVAQNARLLKRGISGTPLPGGEPLFKDLQALSQKMIQSMGVSEPTKNTSVEIVSESTVKEATNDFINQQLKAFPRDKIIFDEGTDAAYYFLSEDVVAVLRSINGLVQEMAYIFNTIETCVSTHPDVPLVILLPQKLQPWIRDYCEQRKFPVAVICSDPQVSRANLLALAETIPEVSEHFKVVSTMLTLRGGQAIKHAHKRQELLSLIDFPIDLHEFLDSQQLPAVFDLVDQSYAAQQNLMH